MSLSRDDIRAAVSAGTITEAQAASILALSDARRGYRENIEGLDEPFELFKGFNEIFIVVGLSILFAGWAGLMGVTILIGGENGFGTVLIGLLTMGGIAGLAVYFTLKRRMIAPSIALSIMFALSALQTGGAVGAVLFETPLFGTWLSGKPFVAASAFTAVALLGFWWVFHVPFTMLLIAVAVFSTALGLTVLSGASLDGEVTKLFLLSADGPFSILTICFGLIGLVFALRFDMSDPHRVTRRAANGFWLHVISAPAIVNTVALTLFQSGSNLALLALFAFLVAMALFAIVTDRRSFLVSGLGYVVALAFTVIQDQLIAILFWLGAALVLLGAQWERLRGALMRSLPAFPGKSKLPPWGHLKDSYD